MLGKDFLKQVRDEASEATRLIVDGKSPDTDKTESVPVELASAPRLLPAQRVAIVDVDVPFGSLVTLLLKISIAALIPAIVFAFAVGFALGFLRSMM